MIQTISISGSPYKVPKDDLKRVDSTFLEVKKREKGAHDVYAWYSINNKQEDTIGLAIHVE